MTAKRMCLPVVALVALSFVLGTGVHRARADQPSSDGWSQADALTEALLTMSARHRTASITERSRLESSLLTTASARRQALVSLMETDPGAVLDLAILAAVRATMPAVVAPYLERDADLQGTLEILHEDSFTGSRYHYVLHARGARYSLHFADSAPEHLATGATIRVKGVQLGNTLALGGSKNVQQVTPAPAPNTLGAQRTLVVLVNFQDNPIQPYTVEDARSALFNTASAFFMENSYQQAWLTGDIYGWVTIAVSSTTCDSTSVATAAQAAATAAGASLASYTHQVYAFPQNACGYWGLSTVGGNPSQSWVNGAFELGVLAHELGHGLGLWHSHSLDCGMAAVIGTNCSTNEYGDIVDMMGASHAAHYNAVQKERLGWLNAGTSPPITTVLTGGTYTLNAYELPGSGPKALKVLKSADPSSGKRTWYYLESRQAVGFDGFLASTGGDVLNGVLVHTGTEGNGNSSYLLDMSPATPVYYWWYDPALLVGASFTDPDAGVTLTTDWVTGTGAAVTVRFASTGGSAPASTVAISTDQTTYSLGQTVSVTARVTSGGLPLANTVVSFTITRPGGDVIAGSATTAGNGTAVYKLRLRRQDPVGIYQADATTSGQSGSASTPFTVK